MHPKHRNMEKEVETNSLNVVFASQSFLLQTLYPIFTIETNATTIVAVITATVWEEEEQEQERLIDAMISAPMYANLQNRESQMSLCIS